MTTGLEYPGLERQPDRMEKGGWGVQALKRFLRSQFGRPTGFWGSVAGYIMAASQSNHDRLQWTISLLDIEPTDRVLEVGFGPGFAIQSASRLAKDGFVAGVDHSEVMVRQAGRRNARAIREGRVELRLGSASELPVFSQPFDKIFTINSIHFWHEPVACLRKLGELLRAGGRIAVALQPRSRNATHATTQEVGAEVADNLRQAGFTDVQLEIKPAAPVSMACARGVRR